MDVCVRRVGLPDAPQQDVAERRPREPPRLEARRVREAGLVALDVAAEEGLQVGGEAVDALALGGAELRDVEVPPGSVVV